MNTVSIPAPVFVIARVLLALMFVMAGAFKFVDLGGTAGYIASKGLPLPSLLAFATAALEEARDLEGQMILFD